MKNRKVIPLALLFILVTVFLVAPVSAGLNITDGAKIISRTGNTSPVITITDSAIAQNGTITIDISPLHGDVARGTFINANVVVHDSAAAATWTGSVTGDSLTLTSTGGPTAAGENVTVTFTGAEGSAWIPDTGGGILSGILTATRTDTNETATFNFSLETALGPGGLSIAPGAKITSINGTTSMTITITDAPIGRYDYIVMDVSGLTSLVSGGAITDANIVINDTAAAATWTGTLDWTTLTLTSNNGPTNIGETVTVTFTGAGGNAWIRNTGGERNVTLSAFRMDNFGTADFNFVIEITPPPGGLTVTDGAKISSTNGTTSPVITIADSNIARGGTITLDVSGLNTFVASGTLTDANVVIHDTAAAANWTRAVAGNTLTLTSTGGATVIGENVTITFTGAGGNSWVPNTHGVQTIPLTASRTDTGQTGTFNFVIETTPPPNFTVAANFSASPTSDMSPLTVTFKDTSLGSPSSWNWDFGDGNSSTLKDPVNTYYTVGTYTVSLTATNAYGSDTKTEWNYINVLNGGITEANTLLAGLTVNNCGGPQTVNVDTTILPAALIPNNSVLEIQPPADSGFNNITIYALNGFGFMQKGNLIFGNPTGVHLVTEEIAPPSGFSGEIGTNASFNYSVDLSSYPCNAVLSTKIWEGAIPEYNTRLIQISSPNGVVPIGTAYTAKITRINFPSRAPVQLHMSVNSNWNPSLSGGPGTMFIWQIAENGISGQILPTRYLYTAPVDNLAYFEADSSQGGSVFGISSFTGSNNPFQIISFVIAEVVNPASNAGGGSGGGTVAVRQTTIAPEITKVTPPDPGKTARIYSNAQGVITQVTTLQSTDGLATVNIGTGIVANDVGGKPLSSITIKAIPAENLPGTSPGASFSFAGRAYELQPDGATFSPGISISFTAPNAQFGQELLVKMYDSATSTWVDVPTSINPQTGLITAQVSHLCCFALFAKSTEIEKAPTPEPTIIVASKSSMSTNIEMYGWIISIVRQNPVIIVIVLVVLALVAYFGWWKRRL